MKRKTAVYIIVAIIALLLIAFFIDLVTNRDRSQIVENETLIAPEVTSDDTRLGPADARITVVHYGYIGCESCEDTQSMLREIAEEEMDVQLVWRDYPNTSLAPNSLSAAIAARCAQEQNAFWQYQPFLFGNNERLSTEFYFAVAEDLDLNIRKFERCLETGRGAELVELSMQQGNALGITAVPTIFIGAERYTGQMTEQELRNLIEE